jgi:hypothetical protein
MFFEAGVLREFSLANDQGALSRLVGHVEKAPKTNLACELAIPLRLQFALWVLRTHRRRAVFAAG